MGQYYGVQVKKKGENNWTNYSTGKNVGCKLMEFSWMYTESADELTKILYNTPSRVYTIGDYAELELDKIPKTVWNVCHSVDKDGNVRYRWGKKELEYDYSKWKLIPYEKLYLVNYSKKLYLDMKDYMKINNGVNNSKWRPVDCVYPLTLLTAVGNGRGGGDYYGINAGYVGTWAGDLIAWTTKPEKGYKNFEINFKEG